ncbi:M23 family metallopeptidase [Microbacterium profundi]|uniref:M23 family metallopeptidase n=1 Tax=Microbacterium profundi TaxID=450380 RepID=A0ABV3LE70_9MICO
MTVPWGSTSSSRTATATETQYLQLHQLLVRDGETVAGGQLIGEVGHTGRSYGTHLHLSMVRAAPTNTTEGCSSAAPPTVSVGAILRSKISRSSAALRSSRQLTQSRAADEDAIGTRRSSPGSSRDPDRTRCSRPARE